MTIANADITVGINTTLKLLRTMSNMFKMFQQGIEGVLSGCCPNLPGGLFLSIKFSRLLSPCHLLPLILKLWVNSLQEFGALNEKYIFPVCQKLEIFDVDFFLDNIFCNVTAIGRQG
ncbi:MAG: hypothetical protein ABFD75_06475 [Smithella sp.]